MKKTISTLLIGLVAATFTMTTMAAPSHDYKHSSSKHHVNRGPIHKAPVKHHVNYGSSHKAPAKHHVNYGSSHKSPMQHYAR